jgi:hypothetical protein
LVPLPLGIDLAVLFLGYGLILIFGKSYRPGADDKPLVMVKIVLHELVKLWGVSEEGLRRNALIVLSHGGYNI